MERVCGVEECVDPHRLDRQIDRHTRTQAESERNERCVFTVNEYLE